MDQREFKLVEKEVRVVKKASLLNSMCLKQFMKHSLISHTLQYTELTTDLNGLLTLVVEFVQGFQTKSEIQELKRS